MGTESTREPVSLFENRHLQGRTPWIQIPAEQLGIAEAEAWHLATLLWTFGLLHGALVPRKICSRAFWEGT